MYKLDPSLKGIRPISSEKQTRPHEHEYENPLSSEQNRRKKKRKKIKVIPRNHNY